MTEVLGEDLATRRGRNWRRWTVLGLILVGVTTLGIWEASQKPDPCEEARWSLNDYEMASAGGLNDEATQAWIDYRTWTAKCAAKD